MATMARQPFAELSGQRLQHLTSIKNRQNGLLSNTPANTKSPLCKVTNASPLSSNSKKRAYEPTPEIFEDVDSENMDPGHLLSPSKKNKSSAFGLVTKPAPMNVSVLRKTLVPTTPRANTAVPRAAPSTAPAGRSPPRKARPFDAKRRVSAPYTRIDPPASSRKDVGGVPFFSLEEALSGKLSTPVVSTPSNVTAGPEPVKALPKSWFFAIHEDTLEQEAENLMEHSTVLLDISSDEEGAKIEDRGKENVAPADFVAPVAAATQSGGKKGKGKKRVAPRRKVVKVDEMDDGERTPLGEIEREDFFPVGVKDGEVIVVDGEKETVEEKIEVAAPGTKASKKEDVEGDIVIFEDQE